MQPGPGTTAKASALNAPVYCFDVLFDEQIDPEAWARQLASLYITHVEFHSYMPAHELVDTGGDTWNSYAGDARLWTSREQLGRKVAALHRWGIHALLYAACYAASPAFFARHPEWAAYTAGGQPVLFPDLWPPYLVLQAMRRDADHAYTIDGHTYHNYREYILDTLQRGVATYGFDGVRMDFYGIPETYSSPAAPGTANMAEDLVDFIGDLRQRLKQNKPDVEVLMIELPNVCGDVIRQRVGVHVDAHWLELWPQADNTHVATYDAIIHEIQLTRCLSPNKPVIASFYPQNPPFTDYPLMPGGWPLANLHLNYATVFAAGASWGGQSVDGLGAFTQVLPFKFSYMDQERLDTTRAWNAFMRRYGPAYAWGEAGQLQPLSSAGLEQALGPAIRPVLYLVTHPGSDAPDALVLHLVHYGENREWAQPAMPPSPASGLDLSLDLPALSTVYSVRALESGQEPEILPFQQNSNRVSVQLPQLGLYKLLVLDLVPEPAIPPDLPPAPPLEYACPEPFDVGGEAIWGAAEAITIFDEEPLLAISPFAPDDRRLVAATYKVSGSTAYQGRLSYRIAGWQVKFTATAQNALRFDISKYPMLSFAWQSQASAGLSLGFELIDPVTEAVRTLTYAVGEARGDIWLGPVPDDWMLVTRDLQHDLSQTGWGTDWTKAVVVALVLGAPGVGHFDAIRVERRR